MSGVLIKRTADPREAAVWYQVDAAYLYRQVVAYRDTPGKEWLAARAQEAAAVSAATARDLLDIATEGGLS